MKIEPWVAAAGLAVCKQVALFALSFVPAGFFLLLALFGWNTLPVAAILGATGLGMGVARLFDDLDESDGFD